MRAAVLATLLGVACGGGEATSPVSAPPPLEVGTTRVVREPVVEPILATGILAAEKTTDLGPLVDGPLEEIHVRVGDVVEAGQALFRTRQSDYRIRLAEQQAAVKLARAESRAAARDLERLRALEQRQVASRERLDHASTQFDIARARLEAAEAALARAQHDLEDTVVRAPYAGVITRRHVDEGTYLRGAGPPVVQLMQADLAVAIVHVPEVHLPRLRVGTPARVRLDGLDREIETQVAVVNDRVEDRSHAVELRLPLPNADRSLKPGLFAKVELRPEAEPLLLLDREAVLGLGSARHVYGLADGTAVRRPVEVRELDARRVQVLRGLEAGEQVLIGAGLDDVRDGAPVRVRAPVESDVDP